MLVEIVTRPFRPAWATTSASRSTNSGLAFSSWCGIPSLVRASERSSERSTEVVLLSSLLLFCGKREEREEQSEFFFLEREREREKARKQRDEHPHPTSTGLPSATILFTSATAAPHFPPSVRKTTSGESLRQAGLLVGTSATSRP